jgi:hypothetical protein
MPDRTQKQKGADMFDRLFEGFRKASESTLQMQQDLFKSWTQQWLSTQPDTTGASEWGRAFQKRWFELALETLKRHRDSLDAIYKAGIQTIEQTSRTPGIKTPEDYRLMVEELWHKLFQAFKAQSESQFRDFQSWTEKSFETARKSTEKSFETARKSNG